MTPHEREVMQMALETAEQIASADYRYWEELASLGGFERWARSRVNHIAEALRTALAQPEKEWVGLTDEEITECLQDVAQAQFIKREGTTPQRISRTIEAKLKEKNT